MTTVRARLHELVDTFQGRRVVVVGDLVADVYVEARPYKLSREAPVVIARHEGERFVPGGGGNVLANLTELGARPLACGRVGDDEAGERLVADLEERGVDCCGLLREGETTTLTRYMVGSVNTRRQQVLRVDRFQRQPPSRSVMLPGDADCYIVSDYGYGFVTTSLCEELRARAAQGALVVGDSRTRLQLCRGFTVVKPNHSEAEALAGEELPDRQAVTRAATRLRADLGTSAVLVTLGNQGLVLVTGEDAAPLVLDAVGSTEAVDVSGAGDTVTALLALGASQDLGAAALLANRGAAVVVMHAGTTSLTAAGLHRAIDQGGPEETEPDLQALLRWWTTTGRAPRG